MKLKDSFHLYAFITIIFWSLAYVFSRLAMEHFTPYSLGFLRYSVASVALIIIVCVLKSKPPKLKDLPLFIGCGATGFFLYMVTFNTGTRLVSSATSSIIIATVPIMSSFVAVFVYKEKLKKIQWLAIAIEFIGILVLTLMGGSFAMNNGIIWLLFAAVSLSIYNMLQKHLTKFYSPVTISAYSIFIGTLMLSIFAPKAIIDFKTAPPNQYINLLILGVLSSAFAYIFWAKAFEKAENVASVSNYMFLTPFISTIFGFIFAREVPDISIYIGGAIILFGVFLFFKDNFKIPVKAK
ncbi:MAG: DMT family transporter [Anaerotignaceae bacterium]